MPAILATWADAIPDFVVYVGFLLFPFAIFAPVYGTLQLACIFFVWAWAIRRYRKNYRTGHYRKGELAEFILAAWIFGGYIVTVTLTNLLLYYLVTA